MTGITTIAQVLRETSSPFGLGECWRWLRGKGMVLLCLLMATVLTISCSDSNEGGGTATGEEGFPGKYITLVVNTDGGALSRADNPNGGENGDGRDNTYTYTLDNERHIHNALMLLYKSNTGINDASATIEHVLYFNNFKYDSGKQSWTSEKVQITGTLAIDGGTYHILVIANAGNTAQLGVGTLEGMTIGAFRDKIYNGSLKKSVYCDKGGTAETHDHLVMTSANDDRVVFTAANCTVNGTASTGNGTEANPYLLGQINVERLAARLDLLPGTDITYNATQGGYIYNVYEIDAMGNATETEIANDRFVLQSIEIVNIPQYGSYLLRRTMKYEDDKFKPSEYFGKDSGSSSSTVWMIDPKTIAQREACDAYSEDYAAFKTAFTTNYHNQSLTLNNSGASAEKTGGGSQYILAAYLPENTFINHDADGVTYNLDYLRCYATKVRFKGKYYDHNNNATEHNNYTDPSSTWNGGTDKVYEYTIRHNDPAGEEKATQKMLYAIVRNNLYRIEIAKVVNTNLSSIIVGVWYFRSGSDGTYSLVNLPSINIDANVGEDTGGANDGTYPTDAPRRKTPPQPPNPR